MKSVIVKIGDRVSDERFELEAQEGDVRLNVVSNLFVHQYPIKATEIGENYNLLSKPHRKKRNTNDNPIV